MCVCVVAIHVRYLHTCEFLGGIRIDIGYDAKHFQNIRTGCDNIFLVVVEEVAGYGEFHASRWMRLFAQREHFCQMFRLTQRALNVHPPQPVPTKKSWLNLKL